MKPIRILLYAVNGLGLGHITRLLAIAKYLRRYAYLLGVQPEIVFLSTSEVDSLPFQYNFPVIKIPSKTIIQKGGMEKSRYHKLAKMMIWNCISTHSPHILVVDTFPTGSFDELYDVMDFGYRKVFIYRPRKDKNKLWKNPILKAYDSIIYINESHEEIAQLDESLEEKIHPLQTIVQRNRSEMLPKKAACEALGLDPKKTTACLLAGGGGDQRNQDFFARMLPLLQQQTEVQWIVGAGPLYRGAEIPTEHARWFYRADISLYWNAFDFVIAAGGYNTVNELLHAQIPTLFFAQDRRYDDQAARIDKLYQKGLCLQFSLEASDDEIVKAITNISLTITQKKLRKQLAAYQLENDAPLAALYILQQLFSENELEEIEDLLDMQLLQKYSRQGIAERTVCKIIHALRIFQININESHPENAIEEEDILLVTQLYLDLVLSHNIAQNTILPIIFNAIKQEENNSLETLISHLKTQINYYEIQNVYQD